MTATVGPRPAESLGPEGGRSGRLGFGILALAALRVLDAITVLLGVAGVTGFALPALSVLPTGWPLLVVQLFDVALAALSLLAAAGLLGMRRWAWILTMLLIGLGLVVSLLGQVTGEGSDLRLALQVVSVLFLNQRAVRERFGT